MIIYGRNPVHEAIRGPRKVLHVWATKNAAREAWLARTELLVSVCAADEVERRCGSAAHQGICAEVEAFRYANAEELLRVAEPLIVALDQIQDPQNLGAICRTAECCGVAAIVIPERRSAAVTPAVCKASAGAVEHLSVAQVRNLADFMRAAKQAGVWCYGADADGPSSYETVDYRGGVMIVLGSEGRGLRPRVATACDALIAIPTRGRMGSLSVSAAAAVLLYAADARRHSEGPP